MPLTWANADRTAMPIIKPVAVTAIIIFLLTACIGQSINSPSLPPESKQGSIPANLPPGGIASDGWCDTQHNRQKEEGDYLRGAVSEQISDVPDTATQERHEEMQVRWVLYVSASKAVEFYCPTHKEVSGWTLAALRAWLLRDLGEATKKCEMMVSQGVWGAELECEFAE